MEAVKTRTVKKFVLNAVREKSYKYETIAPLKSKKCVEDFLTQHFANEFYEHFVVIALDASNRILGTTVLTGTTNMCSVYPKNVFAFLLVSGATSFIVAHNHPGGTLVASDADWEITKKLYRIGDDMDIPLLDHILLTESGTTSLREAEKWNWVRFI